ncbi:hypothetical protein AYO49_01260 [Verrucomicrobiaceae bacterium SCGC AG-212-N21]|nr:hypothetical protein AYO49_01260 [Verrucomicrobiaceae bacterium SCGC AG-212-N21]
MIRILLVAIVTLPLAISAGAAEGKVRFNRDIRPIMSDTCFHCHGPDKNSRKGGLRLDIREEALKPGKSGAIPIVPGKPDESEIITRIFTTDEDDLMPPEEAHKELTTAQKEIFKRWVAEGAEYEAHWAYTPLVKPPVPPIPNFKSPISNPIDAFIAEKLVEKNITPSAQADARALIRRLSLDLTGLPPTPEEVEAFARVHQQDPASSIQHLVSTLLKSPHYGERMAAWWLDVARFSDTVGFHGDQNQRIFPYRDYVISAFNSNKRFDEFTRQQLAGDLLTAKTPEERTENLIASGFNRLNMMTREGGAQPKEYLAKYGAERVRTIGGAWLGATLGCCECHDHKFDPFTARDFYSMQAFFADVKQWGVYADYGYTPNPELKGWSNEHPFPPEIDVPSDYLQRRAQKLHVEMLDISHKAAASAQPTFSGWKQQAAAFLQANPAGWLTVKPEAIVAPAEPAAPKGKKKADKVAKADPSAKPAPQPPAPVVEADGRVLAAGSAPENLRLDLKPGAMTVASVRLEFLPSANHKGSILRGGGANALTVKPAISVLKQGTTKPVPLNPFFADADRQEPRYNDTKQVINLSNGWKLSAREWNQPQTSVWQLEAPVALAEGDTLVVRLDGHQGAELRVSVSPFAPLKPLSSSWAQDLASDLAKGNRKTLDEMFLVSTAFDKPAFAAWSAIHSKWLDSRDGMTWTMVTESVSHPLTVRVLPRGNWMDETGAITPPATPEFLPASFRPQQDKPRNSRLDLANWLCSKENPLTPRAVMNRLWKQFFGTGLSSVVDDLGAQGEPPSHPELLDWLASEFRDSGWDVKRMITLMVTSSTYLQSSSLRPELRDVDPNNRLLASQNPRRLDAEFVRDNALAIAGILNLEMGGPSVKPYQPADYYENLQFPSRRYVADTDDGQWRRGVYMHWQRTFLHPMLANFDAPMRDECTANRIVSNTPQQALTLLNDPSFVEAARVFAALLLHEKHADDNARLSRAFELAVARPAKEAELKSLATMLASQRDLYRANVEDADKAIHVGIAPAADDLDKSELASWTTVCRVILNLHETITRY